MIIDFSLYKNIFVTFYFYADLNTKYSKVICCKIYKMTNPLYVKKVKLTEEQLSRARSSEELFYLNLLYHLRMKDPVRARHGLAYTESHAPIVERLVGKRLVSKTGENRDRVVLTGFGCSTIGRFSAEYGFITGDVNDEVVIK